MTFSSHEEEDLHTMKEGSPANEPKPMAVVQSPERRNSRHRRSQSLELLSSTNVSESLGECFEHEAEDQQPTEDQQPAKPVIEDQENDAQEHAQVCVWVLRSNCVVFVTV